MNDIYPAKIRRKTKGHHREFYDRSVFRQSCGTREKKFRANATGCPVIDHSACPV